MMICVQHLSGLNHRFVDSLNLKPCFQTASPHRKCMRILKWRISQVVAPIYTWEIRHSSFLHNPAPGFNGLHNDITFFAVRLYIIFFTMYNICIRNIIVN